jgi:hypothetical protein
VNIYAVAAAAVLALHVLWLLWVIFGALVTRGRPVLTAIHILSLAWGIAVEAGPWPCPLTALEQALEDKAGVTPYSESFVVHHLDRLVYPNVSAAALTAGAIVVCALNLAIYAARWHRRRGLRSSPRPR